MQIPAAKIYFPKTDKAIILEKVQETLSTGWLTLGKNTKEFEKKFSELHKATHASL